MPDIEREDVDRWQALAKHHIGEWTSAEYADYLEAHPEHDPDDPLERMVIERLRGDAR
jgi:hypothetical protein